MQCNNLNDMFFDFLIEHYTEYTRRLTFKILLTLFVLVPAFAMPFIFGLLFSAAPTSTLVLLSVFPLIVIGMSAGFSFKLFRVKKFLELLKKRDSEEIKRFANNGSLPDEIKVACEMIGYLSSKSYAPAGALAESVKFEVYFLKTYPDIEENIKEFAKLLKKCSRVKKRR